MSGEGITENERTILVSATDTVESIALDLEALREDNSSVDTAADIAGRLLSHFAELDIEQIEYVLQKVADSR